MIPYEAQEQETLVQWLEFKGLRFTAIPFSTYTTSWKQKALNKRMGVRRGLPDLLIVHDGKMVWIELKRVKGGVVAPHQKEWIKAINTVANCQAYVCRGASEAIEVICRIFNLKP
jgi:hypothetical protein